MPLRSLMLIQAARLKSPLMEVAGVGDRDLLPAEAKLSAPPATPPALLQLPPVTLPVWPPMASPAEAPVVSSSFPPGHPAADAVLGRVERAAGGDVLDDQLGDAGGVGGLGRGVAPLKLEGGRAGTP